MNDNLDLPNLLELPSDLMTEEPEAFKQWLLVAVAARRSTVVSGKGVTRIGTAALQLLVAFRRECLTNGVSFELREPSRPLLEAIACTGLGGELAIESTA